jgi:hypothetical protein
VPGKDSPIRPSVCVWSRQISGIQQWCIDAKQFHESRLLPKAVKACRSTTQRAARLSYLPLYIFSLFHSKANQLGDYWAVALGETRFTEIRLHSGERDLTIAVPMQVLGIYPEYASDQETILSLDQEGFSWSGVCSFLSKLMTLIKYRTT